jgi:glycosyltransferase involved in cell wall biosynthesis
VTVDIMMPFWGDPGLLEIAVTSVLAQTDPRWRLVVIDDRYPGDTHTRFLAGIDDVRVELMVNDVNLGVAGNFQRSVDLARADHLVIMGCDDVLLPDYVARMHELIAAHPDATYFQPGVRVIDTTGRQTMPLADRVKNHYRPSRRALTVLQGQDLAVSLLRGNWTYFPSICWRTDELRRFGFRRDLEVVLDLAMQFRIAVDGGSLVVDNSDTFEYRRHGASVSSLTAVDGTRFEEERRFFHEAVAESDSLGWRRARRIARHHWSSRLNAITRLPAAIASRDAAGIRELVRHATST